MSALPYANPLLEVPARALPRHIGIIGAGAIGPDIAYYLLGSGLPLKVTLLDIHPPAIDAEIQYHQRLGQIAVRQQLGIHRRTGTEGQGPHSRRVPDRLPHRRGEARRRA